MRTPGKTGAMTPVTPVLHSSAANALGHHVKSPWDRIRSIGVVIPCTSISKRTFISL